MPIVKISDFLTRVKKPIDIKDDERYKRITIKINHLGVLLRDIQEGHLIGTKKQFIVSKGQFILSKIDAMNGAFGIVSDDLDGAIITGNFWTFDFDENKVNLDWFNLFTSSNEFVEICRKASSGTTHRKYLDEKKFNNYELELPDKKTQVEVVEKIKSIVSYQEEVKKEVEKQLKTISALKQSILQDAIQGKLVLQNPNDESAKKLLERIIVEKEELIKEGKLRKEKPLPVIKSDEIPFELPKGWVWSRLKEIGITQTGTTPPTGERKYFGDKYPFIKPADITGKSINYYNEGLSESGVKKGVLIRQDSVMMVCIGGSIGKCFFTDRECSCNQQLNTVSPLGNIPSLFIYRLLSTDYFQERVKLDATGSATPIINRGKWENILIPIPPLSEQNRIVIKIESLMKICDEQEKNITEAKENINKLNQAILREMFN